MKAFRLMRSGIAVLAVAAAVQQAGAQTIVIDEGGFKLLLHGQEVGTETFYIRQNGTGENAVIIAAGKVVMDTARGSQTLNAQLEMSGSGLRPAAYQVQVEGANAERISGKVVSGRFSARIISSAGEQMREYLASDGAVVADEGVAHHYYFLAQRLGTESARVPMIIPRQSRQMTATVSQRGSESVSIAGARVPGRHLVITVPGGPERHVWVDSQGRVLRFEIPSRNFVAERIAAPK